MDTQRDTAPDAANPTEARSTRRSWRRLPVVPRALLNAFLVSLFGSFLWGALLGANLSAARSVPWAALVMALYLWPYWRYLGGWGWPRSTSAARRDNLGARSLPPAIWRWSLVAGGLMVAANVPLTIVLGTFFPLQQSLPSVLADLPPATFIGLTLMTSLVAGLVEEAAFRGYLQTPIARLHGPAVAIFVSTLAFTLAHPSPGRGLTLANLTVIAFAGFGYGLLRHCSGSILPGALLHAVGNVVGFAALWWLHTYAGTRDWRAMSLTEAVRNPLFLFDLGAAMLLIAACFWGYRRLWLAARSGHASSTASEGSPDSPAPAPAKGFP
jgi:membrane protease YdiL (CAAX protease family)